MVAFQGLHRIRVWRSNTFSPTGVSPHRASHGILSTRPPSKHGASATQIGMSLLLLLRPLVVACCTIRCVMCAFTSPIVMPNQNHGHNDTGHWN